MQQVVLRRDQQKKVIGGMQHQCLVLVWQAARQWSGEEVTRLGVRDGCKGQKHCICGGSL